MEVLQMGVYDFLKGPCPVCGKETEEQIKWFSEPNFREFRTGDELPTPPADGEYVTAHCYCECEGSYDEYCEG